MKFLMAFLVTVVGLSYWLWSQGVGLDKVLKMGKGSSSEIHIKQPPHFVLRDENKKVLGFGLPLDSQTAAFFDGFSQIPVFRNEDKIELSLRDFDTKVAYGAISYWQGDLPEWSQTAPIVGKTVYWLSQFGISEGTVLSVESDSSYARPVVIKGTPELDSLGSPVFDSRGRVYGILTGADTSKKEIYMTRIERVRDSFSY